jgi:hypothetical protein
MMEVRYPAFTANGSPVPARVMDADDTSTVRPLARLVADVRRALLALLPLARRERCCARESGLPSRKWCLAGERRALEGHQNFAHVSPSNRGAGDDGTCSRPASVMMNRPRLAERSHPCIAHALQVRESAPPVVFKRR